MIKYRQLRDFKIRPNGQVILKLIQFLTYVFLISDLADLVEMVYKVLWLMENLQASGTLRVCHIDILDGECFCFYDT